MKKVLGILIVGLLVCSTANAKSIFDYIKIGDSKKRVKKYVYAFGGMQGRWKKTDEMLITSEPEASAICSFAWIKKGEGKTPEEVRNKYFPKYKIEVTPHFSRISPYKIVDNAPWYVFENVTKPIKSGGGFCWEGNGTLKAVVFSEKEAYDIVGPGEYAKKLAEDAEAKKLAEDAEAKKLAADAEAKRLAGITTEEKEQIEMASMVDDAKNTCKDLGFEEGTDRFVDCSFKLYTQRVELAAKQNQQIVVQGQSSGSNVMTIYDPVRDNNALIKRGQGLINGTCTLGNLSTC